MEQEVAQLLGDTFSPSERNRFHAENSLQQLYANPEFPLVLVSLAFQTSASTEIRQSALLILKNYVLAGWSSSLEEFKGQVLLANDVKARVRDAVLELSTSDSVDRKIQNAASNVVSKIAGADYPDEWPYLLDTLLQIIPQASDERLHGALKVLGELVEDGLDEAQFFHVAQNLVSVLHNVAADESKKPVLRALAVSVFRECFNTLQVVMGDHRNEVRTFAEQSLAGWVPLFLNVMNMPLDDPAHAKQAEDEGSSDPHHGLVAFKVQIARVLVTIRSVFPSVLSPQSPSLFSAVWEELSRMQPAYQKTYIEDDINSRLEDADGLPYTLDFLVLEDLDFLQSCIRAPPVRKELEKQLAPAYDTSQSGWMLKLIELASSYAQITNEEEGMWEIDVNVFLSEETSVTANYTARIASGDLAIKLGEWLKDVAINGISEYMKTLFPNGQDWRRQEASLYILDQILGEWHESNKTLTPDVCQSFFQFAQLAQKYDNAFVRARGYIVAGSLLKVSGDALHSVAGVMMTDNIRRTLEDESDIVQVSCIRALQHFVQSLPSEQTLPLQGPIIQALQQWVSSKQISELTEGDDILITLVETLRDVIMLDMQVCIHGGGLNLLFNLVSQAPENFQMTNLVSETFEEICSGISRLGSHAYVQLCERVIPSLTGAFDLANMTEQTELQMLAADLIAQLTKFAPEPLPHGFVQQLMPKLNFLIMNADDDDILRNSTLAVKYILTHDANQLLAWHSDNGKTGLDVILLIIDRLLNPSVDDNSAAEVGGLAAEVVEKIGSDKLGPYLMQLLQAVAVRVATAEKAPFVQSLTMVFARLSLSNPRDVVDFLIQVPIGNENGLQVVMNKWLENTSSFAGYDEIRQNTFALSKLYELHDERLGNINVKGDLIVQQSNMIMTRSKAKRHPDQYTIIPAPLKIIKVLIDELSSASAIAGGPGALAPNPDDDDDEEEVSDDDGEWEDEDPTLTASLGVSKEELMKFAEETPGARRQADDETQNYLASFFKNQGQDPRFQELYSALTPMEQERLQTLAG